MDTAIRDESLDGAFVHRFSEAPAPGTNALMHTVNSHAMDGVLLSRGWNSFSSPINVAKSGAYMHGVMPDEGRDVLLDRFAHDPRNPKNPLRLIIAFGGSFGEVASDGREALLGLDGAYGSVNAWQMTLAPLATPAEDCRYALFATVPLLLRDTVSGRLRTVLAHVDLAKVELHDNERTIHFVAVDRPVATHFGFNWRPSELTAMLSESEPRLKEIYAYLTGTDGTLH